MPREITTALNMEVIMPRQCTTAKPAHRPATEHEQRNAGNQRGDVRIEDRRPGALVAGRYRRLRRGAVAQFLPDPLIDQNVESMAMPSVNAIAAMPAASA